MNAVKKAVAGAIENAQSPVTSPYASVTKIDSEGRPRKQADILVDIGQKHTLFRDTDGTAFAAVTIGDHDEVQRIDSSSYREVIAEAYLRVTGKGCNRNAQSDAITTLSSLARFEGDTHRVWIRTASDDDKIVLDMGRADWKCIEVDSSGWRWCKQPPMFRRAGAPLPLPEPKQADFGKLWQYVNVEIKHRPLVGGFLLASLRPVGPYPQLHLSGEHGSGKSTLAKLLKSLVDPSASPLRAPPKDPRDLLVGALNGWCLSLDNLSFLTPQLSDALCRIATGGAISERQLYTNADEVLIEVQRPVILNGIEDLAVRPDLADRGLHVECEVIENRRSERELWQAFDTDKPYIFGALLQGLSLAIRDHADIDVGQLPRMADFAKWAAAGMPALGFDADIFMQSYRDNISIGQAAGIESSPVGRAVIDFMRTRTEWTGTAADLATALSRQVDEATVKSHAWPKSPRGLSGVVRRLTPALRLAGIGVTTSRESTGRRLTLCSRGKQPSQPSQPSFTGITDDGSDANDGRNRELHDDRIEFDL